jgi:hypothetical protein
MRYSPRTGKPLCTVCGKPATHRLAYTDRFANKTEYASLCGDHATQESEPIPEKEEQS